MLLRFCWGTLYRSDRQRCGSVRVRTHELYPSSGHFWGHRRGVFPAPERRFYVARVITPDRANCKPRSEAAIMLFRGTTTGSSRNPARFVIASRVSKRNKGRRLVRHLPNRQSLPAIRPRPAAPGAIQTGSAPPRAVLTPHSSPPGDSAPRIFLAASLSGSRRSSLRAYEAASSAFPSPA